MCYVLGFLDTRNIEEGAGAKHNRQKIMLCAWSFKHKKHKRRGGKCNT